MKTLFDETRLKRYPIRNRFFVAPMTRVSADLSGVPSKEMADYYYGFAKGGFGGIITEGIYTDNWYSRSYPNQPGIVDEGQILGWRKITSRVKEEDTLIIAQLMHAGAISQVLTETRAPSGIIPLGQKLPHYGGGSGNFPQPQALTAPEIEDVIHGFVQAAANAVKAGFDGIELHAANGYLLDQFLTPYLNLRTDSYGGDVQNRARIIAEISERIRSTVPPDFIVGLRISEGKVNNLHYRWEGGSTTARQLLEVLKTLPVDYLHVAAEHSGWLEECLYEDGSSLTGLAKEILNIPVIANGGMHQRGLAQELLDTRQADYFAIGKAALANPDFVLKLKSGRPVKPFDPASLYPNPSLFPGEKHSRYQQLFQEGIRF